MMCRATLILLLVSVAASFAGEIKHHRTVPMGVDFFRGNDDMCGGMSVNLDSGDFFEGLKVRKTARGREFYKHSEKVEFFPDQVTISARIITASCIGPPDPRQKSANLEHFDEVFIKSLRFSGYWKNGFATQVADLGLFSDGAELVPDNFPADTKIWKYELRILSASIPIDSSLVINVLSADGKLVDRFSTRL
jgi:hypothetical protein